MLDKKGYCYAIAGENIGWNNYPDDVATGAVHAAFMKSSGHRANILGKKWDVIGVGAYKGPTGKKMWTVIFADRCGGTKSPSGSGDGQRLEVRRQHEVPAEVPAKAQGQADPQADAQAHAQADPLQDDAAAADGPARARCSAQALRTRSSPTADADGAASGDWTPPGQAAGDDRPTACASSTPPRRG